MESAELPPPPAYEEFNDDPVVTIHPLQEGGVLMKVQPPLQPPTSVTGHIPCDIVLVIDVSGSMDELAPIPNQVGAEGNAQENTGLTVLDITKHAAQTILSTLNEGDRLGIVKFRFNASVVQDLTPMTEHWKAQARKNINSLRPDGTTNLWDGIKYALRMFESNNEGGRVPAIVVLTDGRPNVGSPSRGFVGALRSMGTLPAVIHTFGFGYDIQSKLLSCIAEAAHGNYTFIPDSGMIGTALIHATAHLQSTYATRCELKITAPEGVCLETTTGMPLSQLDDEDAESQSITIQLGNLQYGQSRDIYLQNTRRPTEHALREGGTINAELRYSRMGSTRQLIEANQDVLATSPLSEEVIAYHQSRSMICRFLLYASTDGLEDGFNSSHPFAACQKRFQEVLSTIPARSHKDVYNKSLMADLRGQISEALSDQRYFNRWGRHFFLSLWFAHAKQLRNTFKDPGPSKYNENEFFIKCRDDLDTAFENIPPPRPSRASEFANIRTLNEGNMLGYNLLSTDTMSYFNDSSRPCFAASSPVLLATGDEVPVGTLRKGSMVTTPSGPRSVRAILTTEVRDAMMIKIGELLITHWHPVNSTEYGWILPVDVPQKTSSFYSGSICSVLLEPDEDAATHAIRVGGVWVVTLGHGILRGVDARAHSFLGNYNDVWAEFESLGSSGHGVYRSSRVRRDNIGFVCGFKPVDEGDGESIQSNEASGSPGRLVNE
ncbi:hint-domain-containing protein [Nemania sp. FL0916]|nr:hint-domain-containing protein [Nemania sp. FL0916]